MAEKIREERETTQRKEGKTAGKSREEKNKSKNWEMGYLTIFSPQSRFCKATAWNFAAFQVTVEPPLKATSL